ncbi:TRAP transporter substrate-binding protein [Gracilibacillus dipsosauri]|uniref:C4-dicarboxylate ABC transporter n=1 Tax=Gracilibacillus dipsosauri TaxID=178340 RepID=A0A317L1X6_9BACI|nr:TRAP transporter substrate-binding protein [Gracilibacillus dipsosauri]PWU69496.1 C4-dicarboxylate ABC transporter [Gracilibacillus dipsosauri]
MKRKIFLMFIVMVSAITLLASCSNSSDNKEGSSGDSSGETITLKLAENQPEDYPTTVGDKEFARLVEEKTDGRYKIDVYAGGQLGDEVSVIEQVQLGSIDLARVNATPLTQFNDKIGVLSMPFLFESEEEKWEKLNGDIGEELLQTFEGTSLVGLAYYDSGERAFYNSKHPIEKPEDLEGLKLRVQQSDLAISVVEALGASATPMAYEEVYSSLQTGVIDGAENNFPSYYTSNHYEVAKYYTVNGYSGTPEIVIGSQKLWDSLSEEDKQAFKEAAKESVAVQREAWTELVEESKQAVEEAGSELTEIEDIAVWREAVQPVYDEYESQYGDWIEKLTK